MSLKDLFIRPENNSPKRGEQPDWQQQVHGEYQKGRPRGSEARTSSGT